MRTDQRMQTPVDARADASNAAAAGFGRDVAAHPTLLRTGLRMGAVLGFSVAITLVLIYASDFLTRVGSWGYLGVFLVQVLNSATILFPTPGHAYTFAVAGSLNPVVIGIVGGLGAGIGELTGYLLGATGRHMVAGGRWYARFSAVANRWSWAALFGIAALPLPFDIAGVWAGAYRYPVWRFLALVAAGKVVKVTLIAGAGYYSVPYLLRLIA